MSKRKKVLVSWKWIHQKCIEIAKILEDNYLASPPDGKTLIVPILRGGLIPASLIARNLKEIRHTYIKPIGYQSYLDGEDKKSSAMGLYQAHDMAIETPHSITGRWRPRNIIIVDDIVDTGETMAATLVLAQSSLFNERTNIIDVAIHLRKSSNYRPKVCAKVLEDDSWIVYPWETKPCG